MTRKRTIAWAAAAAVFCALLIGYLAVTGADQAAVTYPNDKANHHPRSGDGPSN
jgi:hypothetical protein